ncbi:RNA polymerase sigma factor [Tunicatimonas pelagia]|uniref:RNA polymerase sigma factor n=1 Tax=Tunicatimonas pelagia TaxID=931531 RepID=UPI002666E16E|nr:sigma-70 family RNA polymerase sigma factor [Tunicatimonas pelagia]WKN44936.1 sigma-70 family RNA polymerase sigma factor [Tunicatimonas pelagia]
MVTYPIDKNVSSISSDTLWKDFQIGSQEAYAAIYQQHFFYLLDYGRKITSDRELIRDAIQDLFLELWNNRSNLAVATSVRGYLASALKYKLYRKLEQVNPPKETRAVEVTVSSQESKWIKEELHHERRKKIYQALMRLLTPRQQEAIQLKFYQELSNDEIAATMHISREAVYNAVSKALKVLRGNIDKAALLLALFWNNI